MASLISELLESGIIHTSALPAYVHQNLLVEATMGSRAYGCHREDSDYDIRGIFIPPADHLFPASGGYIVGFDQIPACEHWLSGEKKIVDGLGREFDFDFHTIGKFFRLAADSNPNQIDLLFASDIRCSPYRATNPGF